ncbi:MAG TPA: ArsI/CadI family heavy metal resistance metalloenzyme [Casimicrobiaceae bacterium]|nr:ArsI/CadI family heavy metal resistance metalloenzyme [Casimicrobiaceae bacterium]
MKRFHVHVAVPDLAESIGFYSQLFGAEPAVRQHDYAKWMLDDPPVNFAISQRGGRAGVNHLGFQVDSDAELEAAHDRLVGAGRGITPEKGAACCYARSDKYWVTDPAGVAWETFHNLGSIPLFGAEVASPGSESATAACCGPDSSAAEGNRQAATRCCGPALAR